MKDIDARNASPYLTTKDIDLSKIALFNPLAGRVLISWDRLNASNKKECG
jgi:hypothetical protein